MSTPANTDFRVFGSKNQACGRRGQTQPGAWPHFVRPAG